ncbi:TerC family protein [Fodinibius sp. AD559]|uniref:TerC family protein n=1 Tax=Fodinibius sp. AD559 TaxID=3424179 RepID=UPI00404694D7
MDHSILLWSIFNVFIIAMLIIDLVVLHKEDEPVSIKEALYWTGVWIAMALIFGIGVYYYMGSQTALDYYTGYLIEKSLSVDNIFVFLLVFTYFKVPDEFQHKVLFWGIFGALVMRLIFIFTGVALIERFHWIIYVFGGFLVFTGIKLAMEKDKEVHPERNPILILVRRFFPTTKSYHGSKFFIRKMGRLIATPLFIVLVVIETTDLVFALDSIPAILAITRDEFIIYSSNAFAILGLRALYFAVSGIMRLFHYLHYGLSLILVFVGIKMLLSDLYHIPTPYALAFIAGSLALSIIASILNPKEEKPVNTENLPDE